jgi:hypothetical protein
VTISVWPSRAFVIRTSRKARIVSALVVAWSDSGAARNRPAPAIASGSSS